MRMVRDSARALDLVQASFVTAIENRHRFDLSGHARPWLLGILQNKARQHPVRWPVALAIEPEQMPSRSEGPPVVAARAELALLATRQIDRLPEPYRSVLQRALLHEETAEQIAAALGRSPATVRSQLRRGLDRLRRGLPMVCSALLRALGGAGRAAGLAAALALATAVTFFVVSAQGDRATSPPLPSTELSDAMLPTELASPPSSEVRTEAPLHSVRSAAVDPVEASSLLELPIRVRRATGGEALAGVELEVVWDERERERVLTDEQGFARGLADAAARRVVLDAAFAGVRKHFDLVDASPVAGRTETMASSAVWAWRPIELVIPPGFAVFGDVLDAAGAPVADATIWRAGPSGPTRVARSGPNGRFLVLDLEPGRQHRLHAQRGSEGSAAVLVVGSSGTTVTQDLRLSSTGEPVPTAEPFAASVDAAANGPMRLQVRCAEGHSVHGWTAVLLTTSSADAIAVQPILGDTASFSAVPAGALRCALLPPGGESKANDPRVLARRHGSEPRLLQRNGSEAVLELRSEDLPTAWLRVATDRTDGKLLAKRLVLLDMLGNPRGIFDGSRELGPLHKGNWMVVLTAEGQPVEYRGPLQIESGGRYVVADMAAHPAAVLRFTGPAAGPLRPPLRSVWLCAAEAIVLLAPGRNLDDEIRVAPGDYALYWQQEGHACSRLDLRLRPGPQDVQLAAVPGDEIEFVLDYAGLSLAENIASADLVVRDSAGATIWRERLHAPLSATGELRVQRRFATPLGSVDAVDRRGLQSRVAVPRAAASVRLRMR